MNAPDTTYAIRRHSTGIYAARHSGLYRSRDGGGSWQNLYQGQLPQPNLPTLAIALPPDATDEGEAARLFAGIAGGIALSPDGGRTWTAHSFRSPPPTVTCLTLMPGTAQHTLLAGTYADGMFRSTDSGQSWQPASFGLYDHHVLCLAASPQFDTDGLVFAGTSSGIYRSQNGGRLWHDLPLPQDDPVLCLALSPDFAADRRLLAGTEAGALFESRDAGTDWDRCQHWSGAVNTLLLCQAGIIAQVDDRILHSADGGASWTQRAAAVSAAALADDDRSLLLAMNDGSLQQQPLNQAPTNAK